MTRTLIDDCFRPGRPRLLHAEALALIKSRVSPLTHPQSVPLGQAAGRVLADNIVARAPIPAHTNAAVDGYAFAASAEMREYGAAVPLGGRAAAGHPLTSAPSNGTAVRILTGAVMPAGLDTVVMQEDVRIDETGPGPVVHIPSGLKPGANVRKAGEDVAAGAPLLSAGDTLRPQDLAALASAGHDTVGCFARVRVAICSTGDEVVAAGARPLREGEVYDANAPMLAALAGLAGADVIDHGIWPDRLEVVSRNLAAAAAGCDVVITTGGASLGEEDHMARAIDAIGQRHMWQLAVKPGRPMMFGQIRSGDRDVIVVGLPGNPVAVFVCFLMYVYPLLRQAGGARWHEPRRILLPSAFEFTGRKTGRREFWRAAVTGSGADMGVEKYARDGSGLISGLRWAEGLIDIPEDTGDIHRGDLVPFIPFSEFGII